MVCAVRGALVSPTGKGAKDDRVCGGDCNMRLWRVGDHRSPLQSHREVEFVSRVAALHLWKQQMLLSIAGGTVFYMLLVQLVV